MKRIYILCLLSIICISCTNCMTKENISYVKDMTINDTLKRCDLVQMDIEKQREIFNILDNDTKALLYRYKIVTDIQSPSVSRKDKKHLKKLLKKAQPEIYSYKREEFNTWCEGWMKDAREQLKWDEKKPNIPEDKNIGNCNDWWDDECYTWLDFVEYIDLDR